MSYENFYFSTTERSCGGLFSSLKSALPTSNTIAGMLAPEEIDEVRLQLGRYIVTNYTTGKLGLCPIGTALWGCHHGM